MAPPARLTVTAGETFCQWEVIEAGLRTAPTRSHLAGLRAARCRCSCKKTVRVIPVADLVNGVTHSCGRNHRRGTHEPFTPGSRRKATPAAELAVPVLAWITQNAPGRLVGAPEIAAALGVSRETARMRLYYLYDTGQLARPWPGAFGLPSAGPFEKPADAWADRTGRICAFLAADGGGTWADIRAGTSIPEAQIAGYLADLLRDGQIERLPDGPRRYFYLLPGQEPGQVIGQPRLGRPRAGAGAGGGSGAGGSREAPVRRAG